MNRIILIGNGFDLAHGLKTSYKDFIDDYWSTVTSQTIGGYAQWLLQHYGTTNLFNEYKDELIEFKVGSNNDSLYYKKPELIDNLSCYGAFCDLIYSVNNNSEIDVTCSLHFKNRFFEHISNQCSLYNWVDIENKYYVLLKRLLDESDAHNRHNAVVKLNKEFAEVKKLLEEYLVKITGNGAIQKHQSIDRAFRSIIECEDISHSKQRECLDSILNEINQYDNGAEFMAEAIRYSEDHFYSEEEGNRQYLLTLLRKSNYYKEYLRPNQTLILNFNYTKTAEQLYATDINCEIINIHGELNNPNNPIIFGYGDELDDDYQRIEKLQDNDFLENIKSINYHRTNNYRKLLDFIQYGLYQVFVMGHSCGNSDRTLLNTLFEHENCTSVKVFYHQKEDGTDDHSNLIRNISRNFNDKARMRDTVVNWEQSLPLVPIVKQ